MSKGEVHWCLTALVDVEDVDEHGGVGGDDGDFHFWHLRISLIGVAGRWMREWGRSLVKRLRTERRFATEAQRHGGGIF